MPRWTSASPRRPCRCSTRSSRRKAPPACPALTLAVRADGSLLRYTFADPSVSSFAENFSGPLTGTATLVVPPP